MKPEVIIIFALAAALCFHRSGNTSACGPSGCLLLLPPDFSQSVAGQRANTAPLPGEDAAGGGVVDR